MLNTYRDGVGGRFTEKHRFFYTVCNGLVISMLCSMNNYSHIKGNVKYGILKYKRPCLALPKAVNGMSEGRL